MGPVACAHGWLVARRCRPPRGDSRLHAPPATQTCLHTYPQGFYDELGGDEALLGEPASQYSVHGPGHTQGDTEESTTRLFKHRSTGNEVVIKTYFPGEQVCQQHGMRGV